jgi:hypothetical protein
MYSERSAKPLFIIGSIPTLLPADALSGCDETTVTSKAAGVRTMRIDLIE